MKLLSDERRQMEEEKDRFLLKDKEIWCSAALRPPPRESLRCDVFTAGVNAVCCPSTPAVSSVASLGSGGLC